MDIEPAVFEHHSFTREEIVYLATVSGVDTGQSLIRPKDGSFTANDKLTLQTKLRRRLHDQEDHRST